MTGRHIRSFYLRLPPNNKLFFIPMFGRYIVLKIEKAGRHTRTSIKHRYLGTVTDILLRFLHV